MNAAKTGFVLPVALVRCVGVVNNTDPNTLLFPLTIDASEPTVGDIPVAQRTTFFNDLRARLLAHNYVDWDGTPKQVTAFAGAYPPSTPLRQVVADIYVHLAHSDYRPKPIIAALHNTEYLDDFSTDPTARWAAISGAVWAWDSVNSEMDADATVARWAQRYTTDTGSIEHEAQATFLLAGAASTDQMGGGGGRMHATADDFYFPVISAVNDTVILYKHVAGVRTTLATFTGYTALANEFHTMRSAYAGAAGSNVVISIWRQNHGTTKPANPGWYGADGTPDHTYTDTAADRLDDATHLYNGIVGQGQGGDWDTRHSFFKERAISDRSAGGTVYTRTLSDSASITDAPIRGVQAFRQMPQDALAIAELIARSQMHGRTTTDSLSISEDVRRAALLFRKQNDSAVVSDSALRFVQMFRRLLDDAGVTDSLAVTITLGGVIIVTRILQDGLNVQDTVMRAVRAYRRESQAVNVADNSWYSASVVRGLIDTLQVAETAARAMMRGRVVADRVDAVDAAVRYALLYRLLHDNADASDSLAQTITYYETLIGFVLMSMRNEPVVLAIDQSLAETSFARAEPILMEMRNL